MTKKEKLENIIEELKGDYETKRKELSDIQKKIIDNLNKLYELDDDYVKVVCPKCKGDAIYKEKGDLKKCKNCQEKGYVWVQVYKDD